MPGPAFPDNRPHGVLPGLHAEHHEIVPVLVNPDCPVTDIAMVNCQVVLLMGIFPEIEEHLAGKKMEAVMPGADVKPILESNRPLADMRALTEHQ